MVCAVEEIEKSTLFWGEGGKCDQDAQKFNFSTKCLETFVAHCLQQKTCFCQNNRCSTLLKCLPSLYSEIWVLLIGKLWQAYSSVQKFKENITFFGNVILRDIRAQQCQFRVWVISTLFLSEKGMK